MVSGKSFPVANTMTPIADPNQRVNLAEAADALRQNNPNTKTQVMGGAMWAITSLIPLKTLDKYHSLLRLLSNLTLRKPDS